MKKQISETRNFFHRPTMQLAMAGLLTLILMIPTAYIRDLVRERMERKKKVVHEIENRWGPDVLIYGPIMELPYREYDTIVSAEGNKLRKSIRLKDSKTIYLLPNHLYVETQLKTLIKRKSIYTTPVYKAQTSIEAEFNGDALEKENLNPQSIQWNRAKLIFITTNRKGIEERMLVKLKNKTYPLDIKDGTQLSHVLQTQDSNQSYYLFETTPFSIDKLSKEKPLSLRMHYNVRGSRRFRIVPVGNETILNLHSDWTAAGFTGEFLPLEYKKQNKGFHALWKVIDYQRPINEVYQNQLPDLKEFAFGTNFPTPVNDYLKNERSVKYAYLVIFLTFIVFFMLQYLSGIPLHTVHYFLIGLALVVFYILLLSFSEHIRFNGAYGIAALATISLLTWYAKAILHNGKFARFVGLALMGLYLYIYVIIQLENYALLAGSIGLFIIVAALMYASTKIDWNKKEVLLDETED